MKNPKRIKKPFKDSKFGQWLREHDSELFAFLAKRWPDEKPIGKAIKTVFAILAKLTDEQKIKGESLIDQD